MTVKFRDPLSAQACIIVRSLAVHSSLCRADGRGQKMNGRFFAGRRIEASLYTGKQRFKRTVDDALEDAGDETEKKRLDDFAKWLMTEGD